MKVRLKLAHKRLTNRTVFPIFMFFTRIILLDGEVDCEFKAFQGNMFMDRLAALMALAQHGNIHRVSQNAQNSTKMQTITVFLMVLTHKCWLHVNYIVIVCDKLIDTLLSWPINWRLFVCLSDAMIIGLGTYFTKHHLRLTRVFCMESESEKPLL